MRFTEYLINEDVEQAAISILRKAEKEIADQVADEGGKGYTDDKVLAAAKKIAKKESLNMSADIIKKIVAKIGSKQ